MILGFYLSYLSLLIQFLFLFLKCFILWKKTYLYKNFIIFSKALKNIFFYNMFFYKFFNIFLVQKPNYLIFYKKQNIYSNLSFLKWMDILLILSFFNLKTKSKKSNNLKYYFRLKNISWSFYSPKNIFFLKIKNKNFGLKSLWLWLNKWFLSVVLFFIYIYYLSYVKALIINKLIFIWFVFIMIIYWLLSGFVFFVKKYQYSKFTSVIQRFWKRTYIIFWLIESSIFLIFFHLTLNASEEPVYMYDQAKVYKFHLFSWKYFIQKLFIPLSLIIFGYYLKNLLKWNLFSKQVCILMWISFSLFYIFWLEFYQFFHIINYYNTYTWKFNEKDFLWILDKEIKRTRIVNNYVTICLLAKFWHLSFIFFFWIFFLLRTLELKRIRYFFLASNIQNFIILYIMTWLYMYPWVKFIFRNFLDIPFYWFLIRPRKTTFRIFFNDIKLFFYAIFNIDLFSIRMFKLTDFYYLNKSSTKVGYLQFKKHYLKEIILQSL